MDQTFFWYETGMPMVPLAKGDDLRNRRLLGPALCCSKRRPWHIGLDQDLAVTKRVPLN